MSDYDYTRDDESATFTIVGSTAVGQSVEQIEKENGFREIPPGEHILEVSGFKVGDPEYYKQVVDGVLTGYLSRALTVNFCLPDDPRAGIPDWFILPPENPAERDAYLRGVAPPEPGKEKKGNGGSGGFNAKKFAHFLSRLGVADAEGNLLPQFAMPATWKGRRIWAEVQAGQGTYTDKKTGEKKPSKPRIKGFSYAPADGPPKSRRDAAATGPGGASHRPLPGQGEMFRGDLGRGASSTPPHAGPQRAAELVGAGSTPSPAGNPVGFDDL